MEKLRAVVTRVTERVARSRPKWSWRSLLVSAQPANDRQRGQGLAEYALILGLIAILAIVALVFLGASITQLFEDIINKGFDYVTTLLGLG